MHKNTNFVSLYAVFAYFTIRNTADTMTANSEGSLYKEFKNKHRISLINMIIQFWEEMLFKVEKMEINFGLKWLMA